LTDPSLHTEIRTRFADGARIAFNLAPPIFGGGKADGRPRKREFGRWILPLLRILAAMRRLRGTRLDPFGYLHERRMERALAADYALLAARIADNLTPANHAVAIDLLSLADEVRGFGPVKAAALAAYRDRAAVAEASFHTAAASPVSARAPEDANA
jgi:indolepyruvate ferredoxin oxidoreductase